MKCARIKKKKLHFDLQEFQISFNPNILGRACVGAKMTVTAAVSNFLSTKENIGMGTYFKKYIFTVKQLTKGVTIFRFLRSN